MSRDLLYKNQLGAFHDWLKSQGWEWQPMNGAYEVLRMCHKNYREPLIVYSRQDVKEHLTVFGVGQKLALQFIKYKKGRVYDYDNA